MGREIKKRKRLVFLWLGLCSLLVLSLLGSTARAVVFRHDVSEQDYFELARQFPMVGEFAGCSATLVAPDKVLTAAHCVDEDADGFLDDDFIEFYPFVLGNDLDNPIREVFLADIVIHPAWIRDEQTGHDLSILVLETPILNITPMPISAQNAIGHVGTLVGFGGFGTGLSFNDEIDGLKRAAQNTIDQILPFNQGGFSGGALIMDFDHPNGTTNTVNTEFAINSERLPLPLEGTSAQGDSGGPLLVDFGAGYVLVAVVSGGFNPLSRGEGDERASLYGDISEWAPILHPENIQFLEQNGLSLGDGEASGEPLDSDQDGIPNQSDYCPTFPGKPETNGC